MRHLIVLILSVLMVGCKVAADNQSAIQNNQPGSPTEAFKWSGKYQITRSTGTYIPCPTCYRSCDYSAGYLACQYQGGGYLPNDCSATLHPDLIAGFDLDESGSFAFLWAKYYSGTPPAWTGLQTMTYSGDDVAFGDTAQAFTIYSLGTDSTQIAVIFSPTCILAFDRKSDSQIQ